MKARKKTKYGTLAEAHRVHLEQIKRWQQQTYSKGRLPTAEPVTMVSKPVRQVFLSVTLPVLDSYGFGAVVRRSL